MKISTRERILIILLVFSVVIGIMGCLLLDGMGREQSDEYLEMLCKEEGSEINDVLLSLSARLDVVTSNINSELDRAMVDPAYEVFAKRLANSSQQLLKQILEGYEGHSYAYIRFNEDYNLSHIGYFLERTEDGVESLPLTDIKAFSPDDMEHVGWYYVPSQYGGAMWMEPYMNKNVDTYMISYVVPIYNDDNFYCIVGVDIDLTELLTRVRNLSIYESGFGQLYDKAGKALNEAPVEDTTGYAEGVCKLENGMSLKISAPESEVYPMHYSKEFAFLIMFYALMLGIILVFLIINMKLSKDGEVGVVRTRNYMMVILRSLILLLVAAQLIVLLRSRGLFEKEQYYIVQKGGHDVTLKAVAARDFEPFSYLGDNSLPTGHDVELANALANKMGVNITVELMDFKEAKAAVLNRDADILLGVEEITDRGKHVLAHTNVVTTDTVAVFGKKQIGSVGELQNSRVAAVEGDDFPDLYNILTDATLYPDEESAMRSVVDGTNDYVVVRGSVGEMIDSRYGFSKLIRVYDLMESQMSMCVSKDNPALVRQLNAAISELEDEGTLALLDEKWLSVYSSDGSIFSLLKRNESFFIVTALLIAVSIIILMVMVSGEKKRALAEQTDTDALTGIDNRGAGERKIRNLIQENVQGMFLLFDVDKFKSINDNYGHAVGDDVLAAIAKCLKRTSRQGDVVMRFGGDEYMAYVVGIHDEKAGAAWFERLFNGLENMDLPELKGRKVTVSAGAVLSSEDPESFEELYKGADDGAYESKKTPGNAFTFREAAKEQ